MVTKNLVSDDLVEEFKNRMRISHNIEDDNLKELLSFSISYLENRCGDFDINENLQAKELVIERTRYVYNDATEFFEDNFLSEITHLSFMLAGDDDD